MRRRASQPNALKGRTFDLKTAFKQLGIEPADLPYAKVLVWDPVCCRPAVLALKALPFGATGSIHGFSRCSLALWQVAVSLLILPITVFFDDFTSISLAEDCNSVETSFLLLRKLLGQATKLSASPKRSPAWA